MATKTISKSTMTLFWWNGEHGWAKRAGVSMAGSYDGGQVSGKYKRKTTPVGEYVIYKVPGVGLSSGSASGKSLTMKVNPVSKSNTSAGDDPHICNFVSKIGPDSSGYANTNGWDLVDAAYSSSNRLSTLNYQALGTISAQDYKNKNGDDFLLRTNSFSADNNINNFYIYVWADRSATQQKDLGYQMYKKSDCYNVTYSYTEQTPIIWDAPNVKVDTIKGVVNSTTTLRWSAATAGISNAIKGYEIFRSTDKSSWSSMGIVGASATSYTIQRPTAYKSYYYYRVRAIGTVGYINSPTSGAPHVYSVEKPTITITGQPEGDLDPTVDTTADFKIRVTSDSGGTLYYSPTDSTGRTQRSTTSKDVTASISFNLEAGVEQDYEFYFIDTFGQRVNIGDIVLDIPNIPGFSLTVSPSTKYSYSHTTSSLSSYTYATSFTLTANFTSYNESGVLSWYIVENGISRKIGTTQKVNSSRISTSISSSTLFGSLSKCSNTSFYFTAKYNDDETSTGIAGISQNSRSFCLSPIPLLGNNQYSSCRNVYNNITSSTISPPSNIGTNSFGVTASNGKFYQTFLDRLTLYFSADTGIGNFKLNIYDYTGIRKIASITPNGNISNEYGSQGFSISNLGVIRCSNFNTLLERNGITRGQLLVFRIEFFRDSNRLYSMGETGDYYAFFLARPDLEQINWYWRGSTSQTKTVYPYTQAHRSEDVTMAFDSAVFDSGFNWFDGAAVDDSDYLYERYGLTKPSGNYRTNDYLKIELVGNTSDRGTLHLNPYLGTTFTTNTVAVDYSSAQRRYTISPSFWAENFDVIKNAFHFTTSELNQNGFNFYFRISAINIFGESYSTTLAPKLYMKLNFIEPLVDLDNFIINYNTEDFSNPENQVGYFERNGKITPTYIFSGDKLFMRFDVTEYNPENITVKLEQANIDIIEIINPIEGPNDEGFASIIENRLKKQGNTWKQLATKTIYHNGITTTENGTVNIEQVGYETTIKPLTKTYTIDYTYPFDEDITKSYFTYYKITVTDSHNSQKLVFYAARNSNGSYASHNPYYGILVKHAAGAVSINEAEYARSKDPTKEGTTYIDYICDNMGVTALRPGQFWDGAVPQEVCDKWEESANIWRDQEGQTYWPADPYLSYEICDEITVEIIYTNYLQEIIAVPPIPSNFIAFQDGDFRVKISETGTEVESFGTTFDFGELHSTKPDADLENVPSSDRYRDYAEGEAYYMSKEYLFETDEHGNFIRFSPQKIYYFKTNENNWLDRRFEPIQIKVMDIQAGLDVGELAHYEGFYDVAEFYDLSNTDIFIHWVKDTPFKDVVAFKEEDYLKLNEDYIDDKGNFEFESEYSAKEVLARLGIPPKTRPEWGFYDLGFKITTRIGNREVVFYSKNFITIFNTAPTVSYRKNCLGINTYNVDEYTNSVFDGNTAADTGDAILVVGEALGRNMIYFVGSQDIESPAMVDIRTKNMINFIINGGSWD